MCRYQIHDDSSPSSSLTGQSIDVRRSRALFSIDEFGKGSSTMPTALKTESPGKVWVQGVTQQDVTPMPADSSLVNGCLLVQQV